jgi:hypothetical protein
MQQANARKHNSERATLRKQSAAAFVRAAFAKAESGLAMRMRMHAERATAVEVTLL